MIFIVSYFIQFGHAEESVFRLNDVDKQYLYKRIKLLWLFGCLFYIFSDLININCVGSFGKVTMLKNFILGSADNFLTNREDIDEETKR